MQLKYHMITIEDLVPKDHLLRKVEAMLDLSFVYEETAHLYSRKYRYSLVSVYRIQSATFPEPFFRCGIHRSGKSRTATRSPAG